MIGRDNVHAARGLPVELVRECSKLAHIAPDMMLAPRVSGLVDQHMIETLDGCPSWTRWGR